MEPNKLVTAHPTALEWESNGSHTFQSWEIDIPEEHELAYDAHALFNELFPSIKEKLCIEFNKNEDRFPDFTIRCSVVSRRGEDCSVDEFKKGYSCGWDHYLDYECDVGEVLYEVIGYIHSQLEHYQIEGLVYRISNLRLKVETLPDI